MKAYKIINLIPIFAFYACSEISMPETAQYVSFNTCVSESRATDTSFDKNDKISVFAMIDNGYNTPGNVDDYAYAQNVPYYYNGRNFSALSEGIELKDKNDKLFYYALYPYDSNIEGQYTFECRKDQSDYSDYTLSDLMIAFTNESSNSQLVDLNFHHLLSKTVVNLEYSDIEVYSVTLTDIKYSVKFDMENNVITTLSNRDDVTMCTNGNKSYKAILPYQIIKKDTKFAMIETNIGTYSVTASNDIKLNLGMIKNIYVNIDSSRGANSVVCTAYTK